jgi:hypothetical protein
MITRISEIRGVGCLKDMDAGEAVPIPADSVQELIVV